MLLRLDSVKIIKYFIAVVAIQVINTSSYAADRTFFECKAEYRFKSRKMPANDSFVVLVDRSESHVSTSRSEQCSLSTEPSLLLKFICVESDGRTRTHSIDETYGKFIVEDFLASGIKEQRIEGFCEKMVPE